MDKRDQQFKEMMRSYEPVKAPVDFSKNVMDKIYAPETFKEADKPILNKWVIRLMITGFAVIFMYILFNSTAEPSQNPELVGSLLENLPNADFSGFALAQQQFGEFLKSVPPVFYLTLVAATLLLFLDVLVLKRFRHSIA